MFLGLVNRLMVPLGAGSFGTWLGVHMQDDPVLDRAVNRPADRPDVLAVNRLGPTAPLPACAGILCLPSVEGLRAEATGR